MDISIEKKREIVRSTLKLLYEAEWEEPLIVYFKVFKLLRRISGVDDPYANEKILCDTKLIKNLDSIRKLIKKSEDPLYMALKMSISANMIDFGALETFDIMDVFKNALSKKLSIDDYEKFKDKLVNASKIMFILDNSGESVLDKVFIEEILANSNVDKVYVTLRKEPFINDVTLSDALRIGLNNLDIEFLEIPVDYDEYKYFARSKVFNKWFKSVDLIISKGQGNFEIFEEYGGIFFGLVTKCSVIASYLGTKTGDLVFVYK